MIFFNRALDFPTTLASTETRILRTFWMPISCENDITPPIVNMW